MLSIIITVSMVALVFLTVGMVVTCAFLELVWGV